MGRRATRWVWGTETRARAVGAKGDAPWVLLSVLCTILRIVLRTRLPRPASRAGPRGRGVRAPTREPGAAGGNASARGGARSTAWCWSRSVAVCLVRSGPASPVRPETLLRWHPDLVRRNWAVFGRRRGPGRPPLAPELEGLVLRLARENPRWGYRRIQGELLELEQPAPAAAVHHLVHRATASPGVRKCPAHTAGNRRVEPYRRAVPLPLGDVSGGRSAATPFRSSRRPGGRRRGRPPRGRRRAPGRRWPPACRRTSRGRGPWR